MRGADSFVHAVISPAIAQRKWLWAERQNTATKPSEILRRGLARLRFIIRSRGTVTVTPSGIASDALASRELGGAGALRFF